MSTVYNDECRRNDRPWTELNLGRLPKLEITFAPHDAVSSDVFGVSHGILVMIQLAGAGGQIAMTDCDLQRNYKAYTRLLKKSTRYELDF